MSAEPQSNLSPANLDETGETHEPRVPFRLFALKHGDAFLVADAYGDIVGTGDGFFVDDTRILSRFSLRLAGNLPSLLGAGLSQDNVFFTTNLTNHPLPPLGEDVTPEGVIHVERIRFLWHNRMFERLCITNYGDLPSTIPLSVSFGADFFDMFEVRGTKRRTRGKKLEARVTNDSVEMRYEGLDKVQRSSVVVFAPPPLRLTAERADYRISLPKKAQAELFIEVGPDREAAPGLSRFRSAAARARFNMRARRRRGATLRSSARLFNNWIVKSHADLALLTTELDSGPYPYAGVPWFSTAFGRDAIITAMQVLWLDPSMARGVLRFLARHQAKDTSAFQDSTPGKILHEVRKGEMTAVGELPFGQNYGSVDSTPLFVMLAGAVAERTGDLDFIEELWPSLLSAMEWIERTADKNPEGFIQYEAQSPKGLKNQAWKDSGDSVFHADGRFPPPPIAVVEVQGYAFAALMAMAELAVRRGQGDLAVRWADRALLLRAKVEKRYWMPEREFYGLAIDGNNELTRVRASNAGHLLFTRLVTPERAAKVTEQLLGSAFNSGWGLRTLAADELRFNPMSYHNGSVWPHDTGVCVAGMARYGERAGAVRVLTEIFEAATHFDMRLPELYCGFPRSAGETPIAYPVACLPQAWSAGSVFMMLQACLGISFDGWRKEVRVTRPQLPGEIDQLSVRNLSIGGDTIDITFQRVGEGVVVIRHGRSPIKLSVEV